MHAANRIDAGMTYFTAGAIDAVPQLSIQNHTAANTGSQREADNRFQTTTGAKPHLSDGSGVGVVFNPNGSSKLVPQSFRQGEANNCGHVGRVDHQSGFSAHRAGHNDRNRRDLLPACRRLVRAFGDRIGNRGDYFIGIIGMRRGTFYAPVNFTVAGNIRCAQIGAAEIDCANE